MVALAAAAAVAVVVHTLHWALSLSLIYDCLGEAGGEGSMVVTGTA